MFAQLEQPWVASRLKSHRLRLRLRQVPSVDRSLCLFLSVKHFPPANCIPNPLLLPLFLLLLLLPPEHFCIFMKRRQAEWLHCSEIKSINLPKHKVPVSYPYSLAPPLPSLPSSCCCCCYWLTHPSCHDFHERLLSLSNRAINQNDLNFMPRSWREQSLVPPRFCVAKTRRRGQGQWEWQLGGKQY